MRLCNIAEKYHPISLLIIVVAFLVKVAITQVRPTADAVSRNEFSSHPSAIKL
jgi:hypothetical protein